MDAKELFMLRRTEMELKMLQWFEQTGEPLDIEFYMDTPNFHVLDEFIDGYGRKENGFSVYNTEGDVELEGRIKTFLKIVNDDKNGVEYCGENFVLVRDLIGELGL